MGLVQGEIGLHAFDLAGREASSSFKPGGGLLVRLSLHG